MICICQKSWGRIWHVMMRNHQDSGYPPNPKLEKRAAHVWLDRHPAKIQKVKFILFDFSTFLLSSHLSTFRLVGFSSSLSTLNGSSFVLLAAHVQLERYPAKIQKVKK